MRTFKPGTRSSEMREGDSAIFPAEPAPWVSRTLAWLLIGLFAAALIAAIVVRVPETVRSPFVLVPEGGADPIQSPRGAVVEEVRVREGESVRKGETLFVLRVDEVREWRAEIDEREQALRTAVETSRNLEENHRAEMRIKEGEIEQARREIAFRIEHLRI
ncbi:MAG TPA: biotin/lipoyl-binding protein, partial [Thermoanaerobaculia bacterium]|nr:biotin/lipoyl-binding protein [Thermoanaerobaculia bacterium]